MIDGPDIEDARGAVREGVAAIQNLGQLLRSPRVGPRPLSRALPDVRDGCSALKAAFAELQRAVAARLGDDADLVRSAQAIFSVASIGLDEFMTSLEGQGDKPVDARRRLAIETRLRKLAPELETVLWLVDLLAASLAPRPLAVDLVEVLRERWAATSASASAAAAYDAAGQAGFTGDPRIAALLVELAVAVARRSGPDSGAHITTGRTPEGRLLVRVRKGPPVAIPAPPKGVRGPGEARQKRALTPVAPLKGPGARPAPEVLAVPLRISMAPLAVDAGTAAARAAGLDVTIAGDEITIQL